MDQEGVNFVKEERMWWEAVVGERQERQERPWRERTRIDWSRVEA